MRNHTKYLPQTKRNANSFTRQSVNLVTILMITLSPILPHSITMMTIPPETTSLPAMSQLSLKSVQRVLVIAPHPDDETIAPGGLIQMALANGFQMRVVIVTNGDGQFMAPAILSMKDALTPVGYISMGERRQAESLRALKQLGLPTENIIFLGYPDRGIDPMLNENWTEAQPYTAPFTRTVHSPYSNTYTPGAAYCGDRLLSDLETILSDFRPDLIVLPHPADQHSDHQATSSFTSLAVAALQAEDATYQPQLWAYLVHYENYPESSASDPSEGFLPPSHLAGGNNLWGSLPLTPDQQSNKNIAIQDYPTQTLLLGNFLPGFARANEIFMLLSTQVSTAAMTVTTAMEIPTFNNAEMLPVKTSAISGQQSDHPTHLTQFDGRGGSNQKPEWGQAGNDTILRKRQGPELF
jgi:LmbE family N-acetylglucosaminyl deacetylase